MQKLATLVEASSEFMGVASPDGQVLYVNPAGRLLCGLESGEVVTGMTVLDLVAECDHEKATLEIIPTIARIGRWEGELRLRDVRTGAAILTYHSAYRLNDPVSGEQWATAAVSRDLRQERDLESALRQQHKMEALGRMAGGIAHDFNNLLVPILGFSQMLVRDLEGRPREFAELVYDAALRVDALVKELTGFARDEAAERTRVDVNEMVSAFQPILRRLTEGQLDCQLAPKPPIVYADRRQLEQVVLNLVMNAHDALPDGAGTITLSTRSAMASLKPEQPAWAMRIGPQERCVCVVVEDTGCGIAPEHLNRIFEPFFTTKEPGRGTGLGLMTVYSIVHQLGGSIHVESTLGEGSTFTVYLPALE